MLQPKGTKFSKQQKGSAIAGQAQGREKPGLGGFGRIRPWQGTFRADLVLNRAARSSRARSCYYPSTYKRGGKVVDPRIPGASVTKKAG